MKPLEQIVRENEYAHITFWAGKYVDIMGLNRPQNAVDTLNRLKGSEDTKETQAIFGAIKETGLDSVMYPFYRGILINHNLVTSEEVAEYDGYARQLGRPCSSEEEVEDAQNAVIANMLENKNRILGMNENDPLYTMYESKGGESLRHDILTVQSHAFATTIESVVDLAE